MLQPGMSPDHAVSMQKKTNDPTDPLLAIFRAKEVQVLHAAKTYTFNPEGLWLLREAYFWFYLLMISY